MLTRWSAGSSRCKPSRLVIFLSHGMPRLERVASLPHCRPNRALTLTTVAAALAKRFSRTSSSTAAAAAHTHAGTTAGTAAAPTTPPPSPTPPPPLRALTSRSRGGGSCGWTGLAWPRRSKVCFRVRSPTPRLASSPSTSLMRAVAAKKGP
jgi:hypothetical protein